MSSERFLIRSAVYLFLIRKNKILLLRRFNTGWQDGYYSLIAGHIDGKEPVGKAMIREAEEEAGIIISKKDLLPATVIHKYYTNQEYIDFFFVTKRWEGEPIIKEPNKCDDMSWFPLNKLPVNLLPYIKGALKNYQKGVAFFEYGWETLKQ
jgi:8-oxo-dGTP diphosphatase